MDWIIRHLITNKRNNRIIYGILFGIILLDFLNDQLQFLDDKYIIVDYSILAIILLLVKEILNYWYKSIYKKNQSIISKIRTLSEEGELNEIIKQAESINIIKPHLNEKKYWLGFANLYLNRPEKALQYFDAVEEDSIELSGLLYHKGLAYLDIGKTDDAIQALTQSIDINKTWASLDQRGVAFMRKNKFDEAEADLRESILIKEDASNMCNLGILLNRKEEHPESIEYYNKSIVLKSDNPNVFINRALAHYYLDNFEDSIKDNTKAIALDSTRQWAYYNRALSYQKTNQLESAIKDFNEAEKLGIEDMGLYLNRGICKCEIGNKNDGLTDLKKSLDLDCKEAETMIKKYNK